MERVAASGWVRYGSYAILFAFLVFFAWEVLQTPFYKDDTTEINRIVWYRIHCTVGDGAVILGAMAITCVIRRRVVWLFVPRVTEYALVTIFGVAYTALDNPGYLLYNHDRTGGGVAGPGVNYVSMTQTTYYYTCETDGTVRQWLSADTTVATGTEYTY